MRPACLPCCITLVVEVLGEEIARISRVHLPGLSEESKISQYADDADLTLVHEYSISKGI